MARDYKHRANAPRKPAAKKKPRATTRRVKAKPVKKSLPFGRILLAIAAVGGFAYLLYSLQSMEPSEPEPAKIVRKDVPKNTARIKPKSVSKPKKLPVVKVVQPKKTALPEIQYDFYTLLPEAEFTIPDHEIKSYKRAERIGKAVENREYSVQVSSFRHLKDADSLKAKLLLLGFIPKIEKAKVNGVTWFRVKIGPYQQIKSVDAIVSRLHENKIDAMVTAVDKKP